MTQPNFITVRNNTSFPIEVNTYLKSSKRDDLLHYHQSLVFDYVMKYHYMRGMLLYHSMGAGKTILAISLSELLHNRYPSYKKIVLVQNSLKDNFLENKSKINIIVDDYILISSNAGNLIEQLDRKFVNLENTIIIIDEVHNLCNSILNGSINGINLYRKIMDTKSIKLIFLTGTVVVNDPAELGVCFNMLTGYINGIYTLFPEYYNTFTNIFVEQNNDEKFMSRIVGLVSYYEASVDDEHMPTLNELNIIKVPMSKLQYTMYSKEKQLESEASAFKMGNTKQEPLVKKGRNKSSYKIRSRQLCNMVYPDGAHDRATNEFGKSYDVRNYKKLSSEYYDDISTNAPKFVKIMEIIKEKHVDQKGYVYSQFLDSGLLPFGVYLSRNGYEEFDINDNNDKKNRYAYITGSVESETRDKILKVFNSKLNLTGSIIRILLMSSAVSQGISLTGCRYVIIMEPYWNWTKMAQVMGRGVRINSHVDLPESDRNVTPYCLLADTGSTESSTDIELYERAKENQIIIDKFLLLLKRSAIDCSLITKNINCFMCKPTNVPLFIPDIHVDMKSSVTCEPWSVTTIESTNEYTEPTTGKTYRYTKIDDVLHIYSFNEKLQMYVELDLNDPDYIKIYEAVENS